MFHNREMERRALEEIVRSNKMEVFLLYGRRRVGKTALLRNAFDYEKPLFYTGKRIAATEQLKQFSQVVASMFPVAGIRFETWQDALQAIFELSAKEPLIVVLDEFPYMVENATEIVSILQALIDTYEMKSQLKLFLCGSSMSFMEGLLSSDNPLFGRKTGYMKLRPLSFKHLPLFFPDRDYHQLMDLYAILGGIPLYLNLPDRPSGLLENIDKLFISLGAPLKEEPLFILMQELREPAFYQSIIEAVANGCHKTNEIASRVGLNDTRKLQPYLKTLQSLNLVKTETLPVEGNPKRTRNIRYIVQDPLFRFWYYFIFPYFEDVERGEGNRVKSKLDGQFASFVAYEFEEQARIAIKELAQPETIGRYWKANEEIDIYGRKGRAVFVGEVKWTNKRVGMTLLTELKRKCASMGLAPDHTLLVSKNGFEPSLFSLNENLSLLSFDKVEGWKIERDDHAFLDSREHE
jgi:hypothetical protein